MNLRTWDGERLTLARNTLGILRSADSGVFQLDDSRDVMEDASSAGLSSLFDEFATFVERSVLDDTSAALQQLAAPADESIARALSELRRRLGGRDQLAVRDVVRLVDAGAEILQPEIRRLDHEIAAAVDLAANRLLTKHSGLLDDLAHSLPTLTPGASAGPDPQEDDKEEEEEEEEEEESDIRSSRDDRIRALAVLLSSIRSAARTTALGRPRSGGRTGRVVDFLHHRHAEFDDLSNLGTLLVTRGRLRTVRLAPRRFVMGVPRLYAAFRRAVLKEGRRFRTDASDLARQNRITSHETDVVILAMLRNAKTIADGTTSAPDWLETIRARQFTQVFVDEATDFSSVQLACTIELAHPRLRSWFACGDFQQRVTAHGIRELSDLAWITRGYAPLDLRHVRIGYRQSRRLRELAIALAGAVEGALEAPDQQEGAEIWPLLAEHHAGHRLGTWLASRILEVERAVGHLPSIAVLVDGEDKIDAVVAAARPVLDRKNVRIVGAKEGRVVGDDQEVRVFDVKHIKGLEFEAAFFVGADQLAERLPELFDRYLYVGVTRAATYLAITCGGSLPAQLESTRHHFGRADTNPW